VQGLFDRNLASLTCPLCSGPMKIHVTEADILQMEKDELAGNNIAPSKARCECGFVLLINYCNVCNMKTLYPMRTRCDKTVCFDCINRCYFCNGSLNQAACCWSQDEWCPACQPDESHRCSLCQEYFILELFVCGKCGNSLCDHCLCPHMEEDSDGVRGRSLLIETELRCQRRGKHFTRQFVCTYIFLKITYYNCTSFFFTSGSVFWRMELVTAPKICCRPVAMGRTRLAACSPSVFNSAREPSNWFSFLE